MENEAILSFWIKFVDYEKHFFFFALKLYDFKMNLKNRPYCFRLAGLGPYICTLCPVISPVNEVGGFILSSSCVGKQCTVTGILAPVKPEL